MRLPNAPLAPTAALMAVILVACGAPSTPDNAEKRDADNAATSAYVDTREGGEPVTGDWFVLHSDGEPGHLNPIVGNDGHAREISQNIFSTVLDVDPDTEEFVPHLAKSWEISEDKLEYTFYLRDDIKFHDGVSLTANDVKFTFDKIMDPKTDSSALRNYYEDIESLEVIDDWTYRFAMKKPYFRHLLVLGLFEVMPEHIYSEGDINTHPANRKPIGSGPYKFESWDAGQQIVLSRYEPYPLTPVYFDKRVFKMITDREAAFQVLQRQEIDHMDVPPEKWNQQANTPEFREKFHRLTPDSPTEGTLSRYNYIGWNMRQKKFQDKRVRQALTMLCDRQLILDRIFDGLGKVISGPLDPKVPEYNSDIDPWPFDPERAKQLLDEAGWIDADRDGIREKDGEKLEFELSFGSGVAEYEQLATVYQEELKRAGIAMTINPVEWATFLERVYKRSFDACMLAWLIPIQQDPYQLWHSSMAVEGGSNHTNFNMPEVDQLLTDIRIEFDRDKRVPMYHQFHEIIHEEQPYTFLFSRPGLLAVAKRFHGVEIHTLGIDSREWWTPLEDQMYR